LTRLRRRPAESILPGVNFEEIATPDNDRVLDIAL